MEPLAVPCADLAAETGACRLGALVLPVRWLSGVTGEVVGDHALGRLAQEPDDVVRLLRGGSGLCRRGSRGGGGGLLGGLGAGGPPVLEGLPLGLLYGSSVSRVLSKVLKDRKGVRYVTGEGGCWKGGNYWYYRHCVGMEIFLITISCPSLVEILENLPHLFVAGPEWRKDAHDACRSRGGCIVSIS